MKTIALTGPFNNDIKKIIYDALPPGFNIIETPDESQFHRFLEAQYILIRTVKLTKAHIDSYMKNIRLIQKWGAGYEMIDVKAAKAADIHVAISAGTNSGAVSEMAVLHMLALYRKLLALNSELKNGIWAKDKYSGECFVLEGKTVGIIGMGNIGRLVAKKVKAFGAKVIYYDIRRLPAEDETKLEYRFAGFDELLRTVDIVSLHLPLLPETRHLIDRRAFGLMKQQAVLINTARGPIVNEADLIDSLKEGRIRGAGLDTYEKEPLNADNPLLRMENVVLTPHAAGNTYDNSIFQAKRCLDNIIRFDRGESVNAGDSVS